MQRAGNLERSRAGKLLGRPAGAVAAAAAFVLGSVADASTPGTQSGQEYLPDATIAEMMNSMVAPFTQTVWDAVVYDEPVRGPDTEEGWQAVRAAAVALAETANALAIPGRPAAAPDKVVPEGELSPREIETLIGQDRAEWVAHTHELHEAAMQAIQAIDAKDAQKLGDVGGTLVDVCEACHTRYWYPKQK